MRRVSRSFEKFTLVRTINEILQILGSIVEYGEIAHPSYKLSRLFLLHYLHAWWCQGCTKMNNFRIHCTQAFFMEPFTWSYAWKHTLKRLLERILLVLYHHWLLLIEIKSEFFFHRIAPCSYCSLGWAYILEAAAFDRNASNLPIVLIEKVCSILPLLPFREFLKCFLASRAQISIEDTRNKLYATLKIVGQDLVTLPDLL